MPIPLCGTEVGAGGLMWVGRLHVYQLHQFDGVDILRDALGYQLCVLHGVDNGGLTVGHVAACEDSLAGGHAVGHVASDEELAFIEEHEPKLYQAAVNIFGKSYEYTAKYRAFVKEMKAKEKEQKKKNV